MSSQAKSGRSALLSIVAGVSVFAAVAGEKTSAPPPPAVLGRSGTLGAYEVGVTEHFPKTVDVSVSERTFLLFMRKGCRICRENIPFYRSLTEAWRGAHIDARLVYLSADPEDVETRYLDDEGLVVDQIVHVSPDDLSALKVRGLPTLIMADRHGTVRGVWQGRLSTTDDEQLRIALLGGAN